MKLKLFAISFVVALAGFCLLWYATRKPPRPNVTLLREGIYIASQLSPDQVGRLRRSGFRSLIDLRPDGEAADQPASSVIDAAARASHLDFRYIPTPHGEIPDAVVDEFEQALDEMPRNTVVYCRTGRRAVRVFALAEASRADGPAVDEILKMTVQAGFAAEDLRSSLVARIARRGSHSDKTSVDE